MLWLTDRPRFRTGITLSLIGAALVVLGIDGQRMRAALAAERDGVPALVATADVPAGTPLDGGALEAKPVPASALPRDALRPGAEAGMVAASAIAAGQIVAAANAVAPGLQSGSARVGIPLPEHLALAVGDRVAVVGPDGAALAGAAEVVAVDASLVLELPESDARAVAAALAGFGAVTVVQVP